MGFRLPPRVASHAPEIQLAQTVTAHHVEPAGSRTQIVQLAKPVRPGRQLRPQMVAAHFVEMDSHQKRRTAIRASRAGQDGPGKKESVNHALLVNTLQWDTRFAARVKNRGPRCAHNPIESPCKM